LARRIVYHIKEGDQLKAGERFGMMKFGSRMDIVLPIDVEINIAEGDRAVAGETILATINQ
jgi:phosphatidylserine decarboxylase